MHGARRAADLGRRGDEWHLAVPTSLAGGVRIGDDARVKPLDVDLRFGGTPINASWGIPLDEHAATVRTVTFDCGGLTLELAGPIGGFWMDRLQREDDALLDESEEHPHRATFTTRSLLRELERDSGTDPNVARPASLVPSTLEDRVAVAGEALRLPTTGALVLAAFGAADEWDRTLEERAPGDPAPPDDLLALLRASSGDEVGFQAGLSDVIARVMNRWLASIDAAARSRVRVLFTPFGVSLEAPAAFAAENRLTFAGFRHGSELHRRRLTSAFRTVRAAHSAQEQAASVQSAGLSDHLKRWVDLLEARFGGPVLTGAGRCLLRTQADIDVLCSFRRYRGGGGDRNVLELRLMIAQVDAGGHHISKLLLLKASHVQPFAFRIEDGVVVLSLDQALTDPGALERARDLLADGLRLAPHIRDMLLAESGHLSCPPPARSEEWLRTSIAGFVDLDRQREGWLYDHLQLVVLKLARELKVEEALATIRGVDVPWVHDRLLEDHGRWLVGAGRWKQAEGLWPLPVTRDGVDRLLLVLLESPAAATSAGRKRLVGTWLDALGSRIAGSTTIDMVLPSIQRACGPEAVIECFPQNGPVAVRCSWMAFLLMSWPGLLRDSDARKWELELGRLVEEASPLVLGGDLEPAFALHAALNKEGRPGLADSWAETLTPIVDQSTAADVYRVRLGLPPRPTPSAPLEQEDATGPAADTATESESPSFD